MLKIYFDTETFSEADLRRVGVYVYARHPSTRITVASWAVGDGPARVHDCTDGRPEGLIAALQEADVIVAHNSNFDRNLIKHVWGVDIPAERWLDTMAQAYAHGLPGSLGQLSELFRLGDQGKDTDGRRLVLKFCKPQPKNFNVRIRDRDTDPEDWAKFLEYARLDIISMREVHKRMPTWNYPDNREEFNLWVLDQRINDRGFAVDTRFAAEAVAAAAKETKRLARETRRRTNRLVAAPSQRDAMLAFILAEYGVELPDMKADTLRRRLADDNLPEGLRRLLAIRLESAQTSTAKYTAVARQVCDDGRMRGTTVYCGASRTGRWSGRGLQPQNLPRPKMTPAEIEIAIAALHGGAADLVVDKVMDFLSDAIRGIIVAPRGKLLRQADLSNIEGRVLTTLAQEQWKIKFFSDYDAGRIEYDNYQQAYAKSFNVDPATVGHGTKRQIGKVQELFLGYGGGVGAFITGAETYNMDLGELAAAVLATSPAAAVTDARGMWGWAARNKRTLGLEEDVYVACEVLKQAWRNGHPATVQFWADLEQAVARAIHSPGTVLDVGPYIKVRRDGAWLRIRLPSGRYLCYLAPRVDAEGISYMGTNQYTRRWERQRSWGGKFCENVTQAIARDVLAGAMPRAEEAGYEIVLHVHDELLAETPDGGPDHEELARIMARPVGWMPDLPLAAAGFSAARYHK